MGRSSRSDAWTGVTRYVRRFDLSDGRLHAAMQSVFKPNNLTLCFIFLSNRQISTRFPSVFHIVRTVLRLVRKPLFAKRIAGRPYLPSELNGVEHYVFHILSRCIQVVCSGVFQRIREFASRVTPCSYGGDHPVVTD